MILRVKLLRCYFLPFVFLLTWAGLSPLLRAQTGSSSANSIAPGPKPTDVSPEWNRLVGVYGRNKQSVILLERDDRLYLQLSRHKELWVIPGEGGKFTIHRPDRVPQDLLFRRDASGNATQLTYLQKDYPRADAGSDPAHFYHVAPAQPVPELREKALKLSPPEEAGPFRKPDLVELATLDSAIHLDIRYATTNNFLSTPVYTQARAFMQRPAAEALLRALHKLQPLGYGLLIHDAYRPWYVTKIFWDATPPEGKIFVADPKKGSKHNRGCAVDLTLYDLSTGQAVEMPGLYDEMSPRSFPNFPGGTSLQRWHRDLLRRAMESEGFTVNEDEWWHFDYKDWKQYPILNVPFEKISVSH